jgi:hypothetical protein
LLLLTRLQLLHRGKINRQHEEDLLKFGVSVAAKDSRAVRRRCAVAKMLGAVRARFCCRSPPLVSRRLPRPLAGPAGWAIGMDGPGGSWLGTTSCSYHRITVSKLCHGRTQYAKGMYKTSCPSVDHRQSNVHPIAFRTGSSQGYPSKKRSPHNRGFIPSVTGPRTAPGLLLSTT